MNRAVITFTFLSGLAFGLIIGALSFREPFPRRDAGDKPEFHSPSESDAIPLSAGIENTDNHQDKIAELRARVRELEARLVPEDGVEQKLLMAREIWEATINERSLSGKDTKKFLKAIGNMAKLDPDMTVFFVQKFHELEGKRERTDALRLAITCGGRDAAELIKKILNDPMSTQGYRFFIGIQLTGEGMDSGLNPIPVDQDMVRLAGQYQASASAWERRITVGIFGNWDSNESRAALENLAANDPDIGVRAAAIRALGQVGNRSTINFLYGYMDRTAYPLDPDKGPDEFSRAFEQTLGTLGKKYR